MKKLLSMFLVLCMVLSAAACSAPANDVPVENKTEIIGEWMAPAINAAAVFNADGTGELSMGGTKPATWTYDAATDSYIVVADTTYNVKAGKVYDMPYILINDTEFYTVDDYNKARDHLHSSRCEDIANLTADMIKVTTDNSYTLMEGVSIHFTNISFAQSEGIDGVCVDYMIANESETIVGVNDLTLTVNAKYYLASKQAAFTGFASIPLIFAPIESGSGATESFTFNLDYQVAETVARDGMVIGALTFALNGQNYYIDLSFMGK